MDLRSGILASAEAAGVDPLDLATVISYETAGTFDPAKSGPTTQYGQHRGLIQFGEPQARQYGVDWANPIASQLGPSGAVVRYLRDNGFRPGMGLMDLYSTINAGAPGRYGASDANNGGAPGTVADKVRTQFGPHRKKAMALLGMGSGTPLTFGPGVPPAPDMGLAGLFAGMPAPALAPAPAPMPSVQDKVAEREAADRARRVALLGGGGLGGLFG